VSPRLARLDAGARPLEVAMSLTRYLLAAALVAGLLWPRAAAAGSYGSDAAVPDLADVVTRSDDFERFAQALTDAGLLDELRKPGQYTLLAPTDDAFDHLPPGRWQALNAPERRDALRALLRRHVLTGLVSATQLESTTQVTTIDGETLPVGMGEAGIRIGAAQLVRGDIDAANGVVQVVDALLDDAP
jgi:uncharacterized surface protein with fasciclin (FAS1) repeats